MYCDLWISKFKKEEFPRKLYEEIRYLKIWIMKFSFRNVLTPLWVVAVVSSKRQRKWLLPQATLYYPVCCGSSNTAEATLSKFYVHTGWPSKKWQCKLQTCHLFRYDLVQWGIFLATMVGVTIILRQNRFWKSILEFLALDFIVPNTSMTFQWSQNIPGNKRNQKLANW